MTYKHNGGTVDELNELLRALARCEHSDTSIAEEAADALEAAQAEIERLVEALEMCLEMEERPEIIKTVRDALAIAKQSASIEKPAIGEVEYEYEVWQGDALQAGGRENDYASAKSEANHYAMMYAQDGPVEVRIYEKRLLSAAKVQTKRHPYNASGSLSEYGVFPECDAQQPADAEVVFIDGVGAGRSSVKSCRDGVQWIRVGDRVYWPLSDSDAKRLQSACCGNGSFDGPATPASEGECNE